MFAFETSGGRIGPTRGVSQRGTSCDAPKPTQREGCDPGRKKAARRGGPGLREPSNGGLDGL